MNYYSFHIGYYMIATAHLSMLEHGAYRRLLDLYYTTESALTIDRKSLYRLAMARTPEETAAVDTVLEEFFTETTSGWTHDRCEYEIGLCRKNRDNGKKGGRPAKSVSESETHNAGNDNQEETQTEPNANPTQKPPIPQCPNTLIPKDIKSRFDPLRHLSDLGVDEKVARDWIALRKQKKATATETAIAGIVREADKAGWSLSEALVRCCERGWTGFKADWVADEKRQTAIPPSVAAEIITLPDGRTMTRAGQAFMQRVMG